MSRRIQCYDMNGVVISYLRDAATELSDSAVCIMMTYHSVLGVTTLLRARGASCFYKLVVSGTVVLRDFKCI